MRLFPPPLHSKQSQRGKSFFLKLAVEHFFPTLSKTPISSVIYIGPEKITESYAAQLRDATTKLGIPLYLYPGGCLTPKFQSDFESAIKKRTAEDPSVRHINNKIFGLSNNNNNNNNNDDDDDRDEDNDDDDDDDNNGDQTTGRDNTPPRRNACPYTLSSKDHEFSDECLQFFARLTKGGYPSSTSSNRPRSRSTRLAKASSTPSSRKLSKKPKVGNFKNMKKIFSTDYINEMGGKGVLTRAAKKRLSGDVTAASALTTPNKEITRKSKSRISPVTATSPGRSGPAVYTIQEEKGAHGPLGSSTSPYKEIIPGASTTATAGVKRRFDNDGDKYEGGPIIFSTHEDENGQEANFEDETPINTQCEFMENSLILIDDAFCHKSSCISADSSNKQKNSDYINTLRFIQALTQKLCHHFRWHCCITSQAPLSSAGTSAVSQMFRDIRTNLDATAVFSLVLRELQTLLTQIYSGDTYLFVKRLIQHLHNEFDEHPADKRVYRPVLILGLNPSTKKALQFR